jgi:uncharacterized membrane protein
MFNMSSTLLELLVACTAFVGIHMAMSSSSIRTFLLGCLAQKKFRLFYFLISGVLFSWMITAYLHAPSLVLFEPNTSMKHVSFSVMGFACFLVVFGYTTSNPMATGKKGEGVHSLPFGVLKITRHPIMWGMALFAFCHVLASGTAAAVILFGSITFLAIAGTRHIDMNKQSEDNGGWGAYLKLTSHVPLGAIIRGRIRVERGEYKWWQIALTAGLYVFFLMSHEALIGRHILHLPF